jgi:hypothetical protein
VTVERLATFLDRTAYDGEREILIIRDAKTGQEYIGISGPGSWTLNPWVFRYEFERVRKGHKGV